MDPLHIGPNSVVLNYLQSFPEPNDLTLGDGQNYVGYRFRGGIPTTNNWYIARLDYKLTSNGNHTLFWRGALRNDVHADSPYLLGQSPAAVRCELQQRALRSVTRLPCGKIC
jgi:hypothetical protein